MGTLLQDVRYGWRMLVKKPTFMIVAVLTLALGVGANAAIFSIVNAVLLRSLPFPDPDRLVRIYFNNPGVGLRGVRFSVPELDDLRTQTDVFEDVSVIVLGPTNLTGAKQPEHLEMMEVSPNYFSMLGATPELGRLFGQQDLALGFAPVVVISDALWRRSYGADPGVLGRSLRLDNDLYTIVGVLSPGFRHPGPTIPAVEVWVTCGFSGDPFPAPARGLRILPGAIGRLKPGLTVAQAQTRLDAMTANLRREFSNDYPLQAKWTVEIVPLQQSLVGKVRPMLVVLMAAVILIVFVVSLNIGSLLLARASGRQQEMAVRAAMGASGSRMIRQMLTESLLLAFIGGLAGLTTAVITLKAVLRFVPANLPRLGEVNIDWRVLGFALLISLATGLLFGLAPATHSLKAGLAGTMREGSRGSGYGAKAGRMRDALMVSQLAFAVVLMIGAGLLLETLRDLLRQNPGFNPSQVVTANIYLPNPNNPQLDPYHTFAQQIPFNRELLRRANAIPGVELAAITSNLPAADAINSDAAAYGTTNHNSLAIEDRPTESSGDLSAEIIRISPDYFRVIQTPLVEGRFFTEADENGKLPVVIIDEATARRYWWPDHANPVAFRTESCESMEHGGGRGEKYQARRARCGWRAAHLCSAESISRAVAEFDAANVVAHEHAGGANSRRGSERRSGAAGVRRHLDGSGTGCIAGIAPVFGEFGGGICRGGALAGLDRNLRFAGLYGWPKITRDWSPIGVGWPASGYPATCPGKRCSPGWPRNCDRRNFVRFYRLDNGKFALRRSPT